MEEKALSVWRGMIRRCHNPNDTGYKNYGAKGIWVCDRWRFGDKADTGFDCFLEDVGLPPGKDYHLHRINNKKGYFKDNVGWIPKVVHHGIHGAEMKLCLNTYSEFNRQYQRNGGIEPAIEDVLEKVYQETWKEYIRRLDNAGI